MRYGIFSETDARRLLHQLRSGEPLDLGRNNGIPITVRGFQSDSDVKRGDIVAFKEIVDDFSARTTDEEIELFRGYSLEKAGHAELDADLNNLRRITWGVSISDVDAPDGDTYSSGIAIIHGPACIECVKGTATATNCGNFIVPWTDKTNAGKGEVRPYGIARCLEQEPKTEGWRWVMMGQCKWDFTGKTTETHSKNSTKDIAVHFGPTKGSEPETGLLQKCYNRFDDVDDAIWVRGLAEYVGFELVNAEC